MHIVIFLERLIGRENIFVNPVLFLCDPVTFICESIILLVECSHHPPLRQQYTHILAHFQGHLRIHQNYLQKTERQKKQTLSCV